MSDSTYRFGQGSAENGLLAKGWGQPEPGFVWSEGIAATLVLPAQQGKVEVDISLWGYVTASLPKQRTLLFVDGLLKGCYEISQRELLSISHDCGKEVRPLEITLYIPTAASPRELEGAVDDRRLGIAIAAVRVARAAGAK